MAVKKGVAQWPPPSVLEQLPETRSSRRHGARNSANCHAARMLRNELRVCGAAMRHVAGLAKRRYPAAPRNAAADWDYVAIRLAPRRTYCLMDGRTCT
jgi:hypothetical protein